MREGGRVILDAGLVDASRFGRTLGYLLDTKDSSSGKDV